MESQAGDCREVQKAMFPFSSGCGTPVKSVKKHVLFKKQTQTGKSAFFEHLPRVVYCTLIHSGIK